MHGLLRSVSLIALVLAGPAAAEIADYSPVTAERLTQPEERNWLQSRRTYDGHGHSPLTQITKDNVAQLTQVWSHPTGPYRPAPEFTALPASGAHQAAAIVNDGVMFMTTHDNQVIAMDAKTGGEHWRYQHPIPEDLVPIHPANRGVALWDDKVFTTTQDAMVVALDAKTGEPLWSQTMADWMEGYYSTLAPLVVDGRVMAGVSGGELGIRGFVQAFDAGTGNPLWKTYTIPAPGEPGSETWPGDTWQNGGGPVWITGNYDPEAKLAYWGVGNAAPWVGALRPGDNLYTASTIGLNPENGAIATHFQYHWNDTWDWDEVVPPTLIDLQGENGDTQKLAVRFARNGYIYKLDRSDGKLSFIEGKPYVYQNAFTGLNPETGRPEYNQENLPELGKRVEFCPSAWGGRDWPADSYDPATGTLFISVNENHCGAMEGAPVEYEPGVLYLGSGLEMTPTEAAKEHIGAVQAWDIRTLEKKWQVNFKSPNWGPILSTAGGVVFLGGTNDAMFRALDAETGAELWSVKLDGGVVAPPTSFEVDGKQHIAITTGWGVDAERFQSFIDQAWGTKTEVSQGGTVYVFALP
ncbi:MULTISPECIES: PQQ-dependent dehydrogenase, methanol/ethanol family [unclassified Paracoccus (in: a-proteobacteria)]|uniref:PQQ-dependent dehydrogenase, methanol/ethanol family n=1 Tax=unclassified Paracoccus (in: a-proteobacteria) TaxID=2688777 RepID=UPI0016023597|nr:MULTISPECIES: PQQ-dependent dehydrogenase, methanol/ethanol family [unclassified Paracoccus (in: a-proteobacteria)]MBB1493002.1 PQQ-dependent dehydrogenase, methanol/ethanol family [Paracoccus sp. MC1854]MBB1499548.1 PQQ-dependent dehydrogenase, methanol/ethanol family [Paracoccus sp. MC1862]QQO45133.1 PQQ-dependent dehydrogenase, methanol/ethanol family [Paracoccus sp. MC1862]